MQISKRRNGIANTHNDEAKLCGAAAVLAMGMLRAGSRVEVWADGCFWAALSHDAAYAGWGSCLTTRATSAASCASATF